jgi:hypothetical protein
MSKHDMDHALRQLAEKDNLKVPEEFRLGIDNMLASLSDYPGMTESNQGIYQIRTRSFFRNKYTVAVCAAVFVLLIGGGSVFQFIQNQQNLPVPPPNTINTITEKISAEAFSFDHPIEVQAESYPAHPGQIVTIQPANKQWTGKNVKLYYSKTADVSERRSLMNKKTLPSDAKWVGTSPIDQGKWSFAWQVPTEPSPNQTPSYPFGGFLVIAESDDGTLSAVYVSTLLYGEIALSSSTVKVGEPIQLNGSGFIKNSKVEILLQRNGTQQNGVQSTPPIAVKLGAVSASDGAFSYTIKLPSESNGIPITPGKYEINVHIVHPGQINQAVKMDLTVR